MKKTLFSILITLSFYHGLSQVSYFNYLVAGKTFKLGGVIVKGISRDTALQSSIDSLATTFAIRAFVLNHAGTGLTSAQVAAQIHDSLTYFTSLAGGLVPASGGGTTNFLAANGTWIAPPSGGTGGGLTTAQVASQIYDSLNAQSNFSATARGLVPASGGGTTNFLAANGTWLAPPSSGGTAGALLISNNLQDLLNPSTARTAMGLGSLATQNGTFSGSTSGTNSGDETGPTIRTKLGMTTLSGSTSGTNTGDETGATIKSKLGVTTLSGSNSGDETGGTILAKLGVPSLSGTNSGDETGTTIRTKLGVTTLSGGNTGDETGATIKSKLGVTTLSGSNTGDQTIALSGDVTGTGTGGIAATITTGAVTNAKLANMVTQSFKGRTSAGNGPPEDITAAQATALLNTFSSGLKGLVPASGGSATTYLNGAGGFSTPASGGLTASQVGAQIRDSFLTNQFSFSTAGIGDSLYKKILGGLEFKGVVMGQNIVISTKDTSITISANSNYTAQTADYTATYTDYVINCTANSFTVTLPSATGKGGKTYKIKNNGAGTITMAGLTTPSIPAGGAGEFMSDNSAWIKLN